MRKGSVLPGACAAALGLLVLQASAGAAEDGSGSSDVDIHLANDTTAPRDHRCRGVFSLFDSRVTPGMTSGEINEALLQPNWLDQVDVVPIRCLGGWVPVEMTTTGTVFNLSLFDQDGTEETKWLITLRLEGGALLTEQDLIEFLGGEIADEQIHLAEFALCFPGPPANVDAWIQRYTPEGMELIDWY